MHDQELGQLVIGKVKIADAMINGVSFYKNNREYQVFSHEGEHIADFPKIEVDTYIYQMKQRGIIPTRLYPGLTFGW